MEKERLLSIQDYSNKHQVSISTIRRRIKSGNIKHKAIQGKYFILDESPFDASTQDANSSLSNTEGNALTDENNILRSEIQELKMLVKVLEDKCGFKVTI